MNLPVVHYDPREQALYVERVGYSTKELQMMVAAGMHGVPRR